MSQTPAAHRPPRRNRPSWFLLEAALVLGLLLGRYCHHLGESTFHPDESQWVATSNVFEAYFGAKFDSPLWQESYWTLTQPPAARYIIGLGRRWGGFGPGDLNRPWNFSHSAADNLRDGAEPTCRLLWWSRFPMALLAAGSVFAMFLLARKIGGRLAAYLWLVLALINHFLLYHLRLAMAESPLLASIMLVLALGYVCARVADSRRRVAYWAACMGLGAASGLAGAVKLNGLAAMGAGIFLAVLLAVRLKASLAQRGWFAAGGVLLIVTLTGVTFVGLNPFLWHDADRRIHHMLRQRLEEMQEQKTAFPEARINSFGEGVVRGSSEIFQQAASLRAAGMLVPNLLFSAVGLGVLLAGARRWWSERSAPGSLVVLLVGLVVSAPSFLTPLDWGRYYLLPVVFSTFLIALGMSWCLKLAYRFWPFPGRRSPSAPR